MKRTPTSSPCWVKNTGWVWKLFLTDPALKGRGWMMSPSHINNSLIMENNLQSSNLDGADFLQQMNPQSSAHYTRTGRNTFAEADLHLNKYRHRPNNVQTQKRNRRLSSGHVQFILPDPAKLQGTIRWEGLLSWGIVQESHYSGLHSEKWTQKKLWQKFDWVKWDEGIKRKYNHYCL